MKSVCISYNFTSETPHDIYRPREEKDVNRFLTRMKTDKQNSPGSDIKAFRLYDDGRTEILE